MPTVHSPVKRRSARIPQNEARLPLRARGRVADTTSRVLVDRNRSHSVEPKGEENKAQPNPPGKKRKLDMLEELSVAQPSRSLPASRKRLRHRTSKASTSSHSRTGGGGGRKPSIVALERHQLTDMSTSFTATGSTYACRACADKRLNNADSCDDKMKSHAESLNARIAGLRLVCGSCVLVI